MKRNAPAALLALAAFAALPAKSTPTKSLTLASLNVGIEGNAPRITADPVRPNGIDVGDVVKLGQTDDLPGLILASLAPDAIRGSVPLDAAPSGSAPDLSETGQVGPAPSDASPNEAAALRSADEVPPAATAAPAPGLAKPPSEHIADADTSEPPPAITGASENAPKPRLTYIGLIKPEHIVREQRCLAEAVYFEARSEPEEGRAAVAQVVLNRVKGGVYPDSVCGVVYQNRHRKLACQFTFACEGKALRVKEPVAWETAERIARDVYEGRIYLADVGGATHYHANYVQPTWAKKLKKMDVIGRHIFYS